MEIVSKLPNHMVLLIMKCLYLPQIFEIKKTAINKEIIKIKSFKIDIVFFSEIN